MGMDTNEIVQALRQERDRITNAIAALEGSSTKRTAGRETGNGRREDGDCQQQLEERFLKQLRLDGQRRTKQGEISCECKANA